MKSLGIKFAASLFALVAINLIAGLVSNGWSQPNGAPLLAWIVTIAAMCFAFAYIGLLPPNSSSIALLIDQRNKISLSRLQLVIWSVLVISAVITEGTFNAIWGCPTPMNLKIPSELWVLLGLSGATAVAVPIVHGFKADAKQLHTKSGNDDDTPAWADIFYGDDALNNDQVDFSKVQQFFLTIALVLAYGVSIGAVLVGSSPKSGPLMTFPPLDAGFIGIMAVSQLAYISYKAVPHGKTDAPNVPPANPAPAPVVAPAPAAPVDNPAPAPQQQGQ